jgi:hypothetical protein
VPSPNAIDNFKPLESVDWQVHIYGGCDHTIKEFCQQRGLALHTFEWTKLAATAGLRKNALYLIRPDGYIAFADPNPTVAALEQYLKSVQ